MMSKETSKDTLESQRQEYNYEGRNYEEAVSATGFGLYNILLLGIALIWYTASLSETTAPGLILSIAQCDLDLDLDRKGWLVSITFFGMIFGASLWGVIGDIFGRRMVISGGLLLLGIFNILYGFSTSYYMLVTLKFFGGFIASGPISAYLVYVCEFHGVKYRTRVLMFICSYISAGAMLVMVIALLILTKSINITIGSTEYHSWQVFFWACSIPAFTGGLLAMFLPESPKFLISQGKKDEALQVFKRIYQINTRNSLDSYPIKSLKDDINVGENAELNVENDRRNGKSIITIFRKTFSQFLPLFKPPHLWKFLLAGGIEFFLLFGANTMRSWMPQVFALLSSSNSDVGLCETIAQPTTIATFANASDEQVCEVLSDKSIFLNSIIVQATGMMFVFLMVYLVTFVGNKIILIVSAIVAGVATLAIYFAQNSVTTVVLYSLSVGIAFALHASYCSILTNIVPTAFRLTVTSFAVTLGRVGSMLGNLIFPAFMKLGCWQPLTAIGVAFFISAFMSFFLPRTTKQPLQ